MILPPDVLKIINKLEENGFEAFIVGGCVRDYLLSYNAKDWDITTNALPKDIKNIFDHTVDTGIAHGTITVIINKTNYEITTYRLDGEYMDFRRPNNVKFTKDIKEDLNRRDFTINAIAYNPNIGFVDPLNGIKDIEKGVVKAVGIAKIRFNEDALRMLRGVRFVTQLGFKLDKKTFKDIKENAHLIKNLSVERVRDEFIKLLSSNYIENIYLLEKSTLIKYFLPEIEEELKFNLNKTIIILKNIKNNYVLRLAFLTRNLKEKDLIGILKRLRLDNSTINRLKLINRNLNFNIDDNIIKTRQIMASLDYNIFKEIINLKFIMSRYENNLKECKKLDNIYDQVNHIVKNNQCYSLKTLSINGNDLKSLGITDGKLIGKILNDCLSIVLEFQEKNKKDILIKEVKKMLK